MTKDDHLNNKSQFVVLPSLIVDSINKATIIRNNFIAFGFEGLILRNPNAEYQFGKRNQAMFKFKKSNQTSTANRNVNFFITTFHSIIN